MNQRGFALTGYLAVAGIVAFALMGGTIWVLWKQNEAKAAAVAVAAANAEQYQSAIKNNAEARERLKAEAELKDRIIANRDKKLRWAWHDYEKLKSALTEAQSDEETCQDWASTPVCPAVAHFLRGGADGGGDGGEGRAGNSADDAAGAVPGAEAPRVP